MNATGNVIGTRLDWLSRANWVALCAVLVVAMFASPTFAQPDSVTAFDDSGHEIRLGVGRSTARTGNRVATSSPTPSPWTLQLKEQAVVSSSMVRLGDVIEPISVPESSWAELRKSTIGLIPTDGRPLRLMRYRLAEALNKSKLVDSPIRWVGPEACSVKSSPIVQTSLAEPAKVRLDQPSLDPFARRLIERAVEHAMKETENTFSYDIDWDRLDTLATEGIRSYQKIAVPEEITRGVARLVLSAQVDNQLRQVAVHLNVTELPRMVAASRNLARGQILGPADLVWKPLTDKARFEHAILDMQLAIGQELHQSVSAGRPIDSRYIGPPVLVRRGDMVEIVVVGGAVVIRTSGKALGEGANGDLVQIETIEDRKRLLARVIRSGMVEIVTRAPRVQSR